MGRTRIWDVQTDGRRDGQPGDYMRSRNFWGSIIRWVKIPIKQLF